MFERELGASSFDLSEIPADVLDEFRTFEQSLISRSVIPWAEHCSECAFPSCYASCEYYTPRPDLKCRRFKAGMQPASSGDLNHLFKIVFGKWGKLEGIGSRELVSSATARRRESRDAFISKSIEKTPLPFGARVAAIRARGSVKKRISAAVGAMSPDAFVLECFSPQSTPFLLTLTLRPDGTDLRQPPFQQLCTILPGYNCLEIPYGEISKVLGDEAGFLTQLEPSGEQGEATLFFGVVDFVVSSADTRSSDNDQVERPTAPKVKCVVWDLDNTLWRGTLIEDGIDALVLDENIVGLIKDLDQKGILQSVASKNNEEEALIALNRFGLEDFFLYPQVSWNPKSIALQAIANELNIGLDTFVFVDDQPFERAEVQSALPQVEVFDVADLSTLETSERLNMPVTEDSKRRRELYVQDKARKSTLQHSEGDYDAFLRSCGLVLSIERLDDASLERAYELTQRTNQMNFSGARHTRAFLKSAVADAELEPLVMRCRDRFGDYGMIGFALVDTETATLRDLAFSCRIQAKKIEHAVMRFLMTRCETAGQKVFRVIFNETERNKPVAAVFADMGFEIETQDGASLVYRRDVGTPLSSDEIVTIEAPLD